MDVEGVYAFRVTRNASVDRSEEEADDLLAMISEELRERKFSEVVRLEVESDMPERVRDLLRRELEPDRARGRDRGRRPPRPVGPVRAGRRRPARPQGPAVGVRRPHPPAPHGAGGRRGHVLGHPQGGPAGPPPLRELRGLDPALHRGGRRGPPGARHQADALPDEPGQPHRPGAHPGRRGGQAGRGARRAQGPVRRGEQHRVGPEAGADRAPTWPTGWSGSRPTPRPRSSSARRRASSGPTPTSGPATTTPRPPGSTPTSACSRAARTSGRTSSGSSTS